MSTRVAVPSLERRPMSMSEDRYSVSAALACPDEGRLNRRVYDDDMVHAVELERIFSRCWLFVGHVSQLRAAGDFVTTMMGEDPVIVTCDKDGQIRVLLNSCSHKGRTVCVVDRGNATGFTCPYHGWRFRSDGKLGGVPNLADGYFGELDKAALGLVRARAETYKGLIFATWDQTAPPLKEYLGDICWYLDIALDRGPGGSELIGPPHRFMVAANWKTGAENFVSDFQHANTTHAPAYPPPMGKPGDGVQAAVKGGHGLFMMRADDNVPVSVATREYMRANTPHAVSRLGELRGSGGIEPISGTIFPNLSFNLSPSYPNLRMWMPRGPRHMEVWVWGLVDADLHDAGKAAVTASFQRLFGASGLLEQDDGDQWQSVTEAGHGHMSRSQWSTISMGLGHEFADPELPGELGLLISESNLRAFYRRWRDLILADDWKDLR